LRDKYASTTRPVRPLREFIHAPARRRRSKRYLIDHLIGASKQRFRNREVQAPLLTPLICPGANQLHFLRAARLAGQKRAPNRLRLKANFVSGFKLIGISSPGGKNIAFRKSETVVPSAHPAPIRGALRNVTKRGAGCDGRGGAVDEWR
jgi:hypothetical protein